MNNEPINVLFLLATALIVFALGYRFYAKLLALTVFRPQANYSTAATDEDGNVIEPCRKSVLFGHHVVAIAAGTTLTGTAMAVFWGWVPAFLWLVVGTVIAAGTYNFGALWLSAAYPDEGLESVAGKLFGRGIRELMLVTTTVLLVIVIAVFIWLATEVLKAYPTAVLAFWIQIPLALILAKIWKQHGQEKLIITSVAALIISVLTILLLGDIGLGFSGALNIDVSGHSMVSLDAQSIWAILLIVALYYSARLPIDHLIRPRAYLMALLVGLMLVIFLSGVLMTAPTIVAPEFHTTKDSPGLMPWMFITLVSGAIVGFHALVANGITVKAMSDASDARHLGYGGALVDGLLAISAMIISVASFTSQDAWKKFYNSWDGIQDLPALLTLYIDGFEQFSTSLGISAKFSNNLAAIIILGLLICTLDVAMLLLKNNVRKISEPLNFLSHFSARFSRIDKSKLILAVATILVIVSVFFDGKGTGGKVLWPVWGISNHVFAFIVLMILSFVAHQHKRLWLPLLAPALFLLLVTVWAWKINLPLWWANSAWAPLFASTILLIAEIAIVVKSIQAAKLLIIKYRKA